MRSQLYIEKFQSYFEAESNVENAQAMKKYMKNHFEFFGVKTPQRKIIVKKVLVELGLPEDEVFHAFCRKCFQQPQREFQYVVNDFGQRLIKKQAPEFIVLIEELIQIKSWWDSIDFLSPKLAGPLLIKFPELIIPTTNKWIQSTNFWLQRAAILFQLNYREKTDADLLFQLVLAVKNTKEFFIQKAAGWALREYSKHNPKAIQDFIRKHPELPNLTIREASKRLIQP